VNSFVEISYLVATAMFVFGLKRLSHPSTARSGNLLAAGGMLLAVVATLILRQILHPALIVGGIALGGLVGLILAKKIQMTAMPQLVAIFNGFGGAASAVVAASEFARLSPEPLPIPGFLAGTMMASLIIGSITFSGSFIAFAKLQELLDGRPVVFPGSRVLSVALLLGILGMATALVIGVEEPWIFVGVAAAALVLGVMFVIPIGGADMPVVVALLNSYSGIAAAATGFVLGNNVLIVSGALVGASGLILTEIMCRAMNRSLANVLFSAFGAQGGMELAAAGEAKPVRPISQEDAAILLAYARKVVIVPGYGMAVAQAQHAVRELADLLESRGVEVRFAIHPVAGRMPGHMNVLLAEANVPYPSLLEMDQANPEMDRTDVALVIGANDVVNPAARSNTASPIYGMPIIDVDKAKNVIVLKRSMRSGFAGIENELFHFDRTSMLFGDARDSITGLVSEVKLN
jgi:H+-translocating NAD(P) transhydrogenase subunit beta